VGLLTACGSGTTSQGNAGNAGNTGNTVGTVMEPPKAISAEKPFTDHTGRSVLLSDFRGKTVLLFFGYTNCPDVCPTTMADFTQVKTILGAQASQVVFIFITVDPARDTPEVLKRYVNVFDPAFIGLTADLETLTAVNKEFYGSFTPPDAKGLVTHGSRSYLLDSKGLWRVSFPLGTPAEDMARAVQKWLQP
jgi:protein SCO1/2